MNVRDMLKLPTTRGDVGIEIEYCGTGLPTMGDSTRWGRTYDDSLHGIGIEYVLNNPCDVDEVGAVLEELEAAMEATETSYKQSNRAGVHVHVNVQHLNIIQLYNFIVAYLCYEEVLVDLCGPGRAGNFFCLRTKDAEWSLNAYKAVLDQKKLTALGSDDLRYASLNPTALLKFGSLEFRAMATTENFDQVEQWAGLLVSLRDNSSDIPSPRLIVEGVSEMSVDHLTDRLFGEYSGLVKSVSGYEKKVMEGLRNYGQEIAYHIDWFNHFPSKTKKASGGNPFKAAKTAARETNNEQKIYL